MSNFKIESLVIAVGFAAIGLFVSQGLKEFSNDNRIVSVKGLAEMEVNADKVTWPLVYKELSNDLTTLYTKLETKNAEIVGFLESKGIKSEDISISAPKIIDILANEYRSQDMVVRDRYNATSVIIVTSSEVDKVRGIMEQQSELLKKGIAIIRDDYSYQVNYNFTGLNKIKPQMIEEATANAREAAMKFANDSDSKIGKIKRANQGQFSISNRDAYTPYIKSIRVVTTVDYLLED
ncbi:MAG: SIMPL domain-containing protein [Rikenellaceae bacterium]